MNCRRHHPSWPPSPVSCPEPAPRRPCQPARPVARETPSGDPTGIRLPSVISNRRRRASPPVPIGHLGHSTEGPSPQDSVRRPTQSHPYDARTVRRNVSFWPSELGGFWTGRSPAGISDYIELYYDRKRQHSSLNYMSPINFEERAHVHQTISEKLGEDHTVPISPQSRCSCGGTRSCTSSGHFQRAAHQYST